jgi:hypothetical protein
MNERVGSMGLLRITPAGSGKARSRQEVVWSIWLKAECDRWFIFETLDPPGTFVPAQDDNSFPMFEGAFDLYVDG